MDSRRYRAQPRPRPDDASPPTLSVPPRSPGGPRGPLELGRVHGAGGLPRAILANPRACGGIGRRARLRALWTDWSVEVRVLSGALGKPRECGAFLWVSACGLAASTWLRYPTGRTGGLDHRRL